MASPIITEQPSVDVGTGSSGTTTVINVDCGEVLNQAKDCAKKTAYVGAMAACFGAGWVAKAALENNGCSGTKENNNRDFTTTQSPWGGPGWNGYPPKFGKFY